MVAPILIIAIALAMAFSMGIFTSSGKKSRVVAGVMMTAALSAMTLISLQWLWAFMKSGQAAEYVFTAGSKPPFSINLLMGSHEAFFTLIINIAGLLGGIYCWDALQKKGRNSMIVLLLLIMALNGVIMTRDLFNLFVFMEIASIATIGLVILKGEVKPLSAAFKYMLAVGVISSLLLLGIIFAYYFGGSLNIDGLSAAGIYTLKGGLPAVFLIIIALVLELKPFPANGWALDTYEAANPGVSAIISAASASAIYFALAKLLPLGGDTWYPLVAAAGMLSFLGANLTALKQVNPRRLLGYSSVGQVGLLLVVLGLKKHLGDSTDLIAFGLIMGHFLAKAVLFWLSGIVNKSKLTEWVIIRKKPLLLVAMGTAVFMLIGFPPFPSFFAKWELVMKLTDAGLMPWLALILLGSLLEAVYLFRWLGYAVKGDNVSAKDDAGDNEKLSVPVLKFIPVAVFTIAAYVVGMYTGTLVNGGTTLNYIPFLFAVAMFLLDFLPAKLKNTIAIAGLGYYSWMILPGLTDFRFIFGVIFLLGGIVLLLAGYAWKGRRTGFYPSAMLMYAGLAYLVQAGNVLQFFFAWELMTVGSYFLIIRGKRSLHHALSYMLFSTGGAYLILAGLGMAHVGQQILDLSILNASGDWAPWIYLLLVLGFLTKTASVPLHIWLPGAHAEAETDVSPMVSAVLLKAGVFGLVMIMPVLGTMTLGHIDLTYWLGWLGAGTALIGNLKAIFQEDAKRLLAWSSVGQLGYVVVGLAMMSHLGWLTAVTFTFNHFIFKALLFLAVGGVVMRVKTRNMYEMGGLIKKMPFSFIAVLMGIITLAGVPPLSGFAGKWLFYNAVLEKGWYLQAGVITFSGMLAFLYCFRLIHTIFLGQPKDNHKNIKEAPFWLLVPQYMFIMVIMAFSLVPNMILKPVGDVLKNYFPNGALTWKGNLAISQYGHWDGMMIMNIAGAIFAVVFIFLLIMNRKAQKVKAFNIVFAAERPQRPETTHFAYNFFAPYRKALGVLVTPLVTQAWDLIADLFHSAADFVRRIYNGNGQTYVVHLLIFVVVFYFVFI